MLQGKPQGGLMHIARAQQFDTAFIEQLFAIADTIEQKALRMNGLILGSLFYEPSLRTRWSFESAMHRLGGAVISTEDAKIFSSAAKGETLEDTIRVAGKYVDIIALRHYDDHAMEQAMEVARIPLINAGCGRNQHPTQALLDLHTIKKRFGRTEELHVALAGDLENGRTVHSLAYLLGKYRGNRLILVSPPELRMPQGVKDYLERHDVQWREVLTLEEIAEEVDVIYQTRVQRERFSDEAAYERLKDSYRIDAALVSRMRETAVIMHPLPRNSEIARDVDEMPNAAYLDDQIESGVAIRKALLLMVAGRA